MYRIYISHSFRVWRNTSYYSLRHIRMPSTEIILFLMITKQGTLGLAKRCRVIWWFFLGEVWRKPSWCSSCWQPVWNSSVLSNHHTMTGTVSPNWKRPVQIRLSSFAGKRKTNNYRCICPIWNLTVGRHFAGTFQVLHHHSSCWQTKLESARQVNTFLYKKKGKNNILFFLKKKRSPVTSFSVTCQHLGLTIVQAKLH